MAKRRLNGMHESVSVGGRKGGYDEEGKLKLRRPQYCPNCPTSPPSPTRPTCPNSSTFPTYPPSPTRLTCPTSSDLSDLPDLMKMSLWEFMLFATHLSYEISCFLVRYKISLWRCYDFDISDFCPDEMSWDCLLILNAFWPPSEISLWDFMLFAA